MKENRKELFPDNFRELMLTSKQKEESQNSQEKKLKNRERIINVCVNPENVGNYITREKVILKSSRTRLRMSTRNRMSIQDYLGTVQLL